MTEVIPYVIERTGRRPLRFRGERMACCDSSGHDDTRWTVATVYRRPAYPNHTWTDKADTRGYVLAVSHFTRWDGETDRHEAHVVDTLGELAAEIEELPPAVADELFDQLGIVEDLDAVEVQS